MHDLETNLRLEVQPSTCVSCYNLTRIFKETTDKHVPQMKQKDLRNQGQFMTKELSKQIMKRTESKSLYFKWLSRESFMTYETGKNKCSNVTKSAKKVYFG